MNTILLKTQSQRREHTSNKKKCALASETKMQPLSSIRRCMWQSWWVALLNSVNGKLLAFAPNCCWCCLLFTRMDWTKNYFMMYIMLKAELNARLMACRLPHFNECDFVSFHHYHHQYHHHHSINRTFFTIGEPYAHQALNVLLCSY